MATSNQQVFKCARCGNIVEMVHFGGGPLVCCGEPMAAAKENTTEASTDKHIPVIHKIDGGYKVVVGSVNHPMEEKHYIEWIELIADGILLYRKILKAGEAPEAVFKIETKDVKARAYCNLHGLWTSA